MSKDVLLFENGDGGEFLILNNDLQLVEALFQQVYLRLFGGNLAANTTGSETSNQQRFDWWGNSLLFANRKEKQFNSNTERVLDSVTLNTSGRIDIERAVRADLEGLNQFANLAVAVFIESSTRVRIEVRLQQPDSIEDKLLQFIWDQAKNEIIIERTI
jgi:phage gp46-like protein